MAGRLAEDAPPVEPHIGPVAELVRSAAGSFYFLAA